MMSVGAVLVAGALAVGAGLGSQQQIEAPRSAEDVIMAQLEAFNARDVEAMAANVDPEFIYFAVDARGTVAQLQGREAFRHSMREYFAAIPDARAEVEEIFSVGEFVAVRERAYWQQGGQEQTQASLAVYEIRNGLILHVWYYPAVP